MMRHILRPRHSLLSVANEIENGLEREAVYLNDEALVEAGYEIHEFEEPWYSLELPLTAVSVTLAVGLISVVEKLLVPYSSVYRHVSETLIAVLLVNFAALWAPLLYRLLPRKRRLITRQSSRTR